MEEKDLKKIESMTPNLVYRISSDFVELKLDVMNIMQITFLSVSEATFVVTLIFCFNLVAVMEYQICNETWMFPL